MKPHLLSAEELSTQLAVLTNEHWRRERAATKRTNSVLVGKYFKYRNSYSGSDHWWLFSYVERMDKKGQLKGWRFQVTPNNEIHIELDQWLSVMGDETSGTEFWAAYRQALRKVPKARVK